MEDQDRPEETRKKERPVEKNIGIVQEIWAFLRVRKKFWLAPIIISILLLGLLILVAAQSPIVAPFVYAL